MNDKLDTVLHYAEIAKRNIYYGFYITSILFVVMLSVMVLGAARAENDVGIAACGLAIMPIIVGMSFLYVQKSMNTSLNAFPFTRVYVIAQMIAMAVVAIMTVLAEQTILPDANMMPNTYFILIERALMFSSVFMLGMVAFFIIDTIIYTIELIKGDINNE
ncbi:MAG: hypothetical protein KAJ03_05110 [Gammaproteobacteria bacterium]|nr:hypothetical protein [Gammaproteobacteria bacterium]